MKILKVLIVLLFPLSVMADTSFTNIDENDMKEITKGSGANFLHNSLIGASQMGKLFGFQVGLTAARTPVPKVNDIVQENAGAELPALYNAGLMGAVAVPFGLSVEAVLVPKLKSGSADFQSTSFAVKWNINDVIPVLPVNVALRGFYSSAKLSFDQVIAAQNATVSDKTTVTGFQLLVSPMLPLIEPYAGLGFVTADNDLGVTGTSGTIFDPAYTSGQSASKKETSTQMFFGIEGSLGLFKLGAEYSRAFENNRIGLKVALGF